MSRLWLWLCLVSTSAWLPPTVGQGGNWFSPLAFELIVAPLKGYFKLHDPLTPLVAVSALGLTKAVLMKRIMAMPQAIGASEFHAMKVGGVGGSRNGLHKYHHQLTNGWRKGLRSLWSSANRRNNKRMQDLEAAPRLSLPR